jgi:hypothetical protein
MFQFQRRLLAKLSFQKTLSLLVARMVLSALNLILLRKQGTSNHSWLTQAQYMGVIPHTGRPCLTLKSFRLSKSILFGHISVNLAAAFVFCFDANSVHWLPEVRIEDIGFFTGSLIGSLALQAICRWLSFCKTKPRWSSTITWF